MEFDRRQTRLREWTCVLWSGVITRLGLRSFRSLCKKWLKIIQVALRWNWIHQPNKGKVTRILLSGFYLRTLLDVWLPVFWYRLPVVRHRMTANYWQRDPSLKMWITFGKREEHSASAVKRDRSEQNTLIQGCTSDSPSIILLVFI